MDVFAEVKRRVPLRDAAVFYGLQPNRAGFVRCPFHGERTPSLKLWEDRWHCFGCQAGGSVIDLVGKLFGLTPLEAVRRLDGDFALGLPLGRPPTAEEKAEQAALRRDAAVRREFEHWRTGMLAQLCAAVRAANNAGKRSPEHWTEAEAEAVRSAPILEYRLDRLEAGDAEAQMEVFRERKEIEGRCERILGSTRTRSKPV